MPQARVPSLSSTLFLCSMLSLSLPLPAQTARSTEAELSRSLGKSVRISQDSDRLHIFDPETQSDTAIQLPGLPKKVSVSPDGRFAAVLHAPGG